MFDALLGLARRGLGGSAGSGRQFMSWIHYEDFIAAVRWLIDRDDIEGAVNVAAPNPLPNAEFMRVLRDACVPTRLLEHGFTFGYPDWRSAAGDLCHQWTVARTKSLAA